MGRFGEIVKTGLPPIEHGRVIFVYRQLLSNRVVYSLSRSMKNKNALKQLTFVGKKSVPRALRKDMWVPYFTVTFPTARQGLNAYQKLREMRKLREYSWRQPFTPANATSTTVETTLLTHQDFQHFGAPPGFLPHWKARRKMLMNQKFTAVADLATVLRLQIERMQLIAEKQSRQNELAAHRKASLQVKDRELAKLATPEALAQLQRNLEAKQHELDNLISEQGRTQANAAKRRALGREIFRQGYRKYLMNRARQLYGENGDVSPASTNLSPDEAHEAALRLERRKEERADMYRSGKLKLPKRGHLRNVLLNKKPPAYSMQGVTIQWQHIYDSQFAAHWPPEVVHTQMGPLCTHTAPDPRLKLQPLNYSQFNLEDELEPLDQTGQLTHKSLNQVDETTQSNSLRQRFRQGLSNLRRKFSLLSA